MATFGEIDRLAIAAVRSLVIDMTNKAKSGHPGMALDAAGFLHVFYKNHFVSDPAHPEWFSRDRFVLSAGHASPLLYSMLHLCGYDLSMDDLKQFRQLGSRTPGHPESKYQGIDATGGPLGQGIAQAVGMAIAEKAVAARYPEGEKLCGHRTYCLCGDGCLQEGISQEAIAMAGHLKLNRLVLFYDENKSTLDGPNGDTMSDDVRGRFLAAGWDVLEVEDGEDLDAIDEAIGKAKKSEEKPTLVIFHTLIGYGSANQGSHKTHGAPLGEEDGKHAKESYGYDYPEFSVPEEVYGLYRETFAARGKKARAEYEEGLSEYKNDHRAEYAVFLDAIEDNIGKYIPGCDPSWLKDDATRNTSGAFLSALDASCPFLIGGAADVATSVKTYVKGSEAFSPANPQGRRIDWGIREFLMAAATNGILLHGGLRTYEGSFLVFSDYFKAAIRMASLEHIPALFVFSHDTIAVGEDGPTHQPVEQVAALRSIPGVDVLRPSDAKETYGAYLSALNRKDGPSCIILSRQTLPLLEETSAGSVEKGAYFVKREENPDVLILSSGSEVSLALEASALLKGKGISASVVSMPSWELFERQSEEYKESVLCLPYEKRVSLEMMSTFGWGKYAKTNLGIDHFGQSAPYKHLLEKEGFTPEGIAKAIEDGIKAGSKVE